MKASELMIGDLLIEKRSMKYCRVVGVDTSINPEHLIRLDSLDGVYEFDKFGENLEPIPLTEEILKLNGWVWDNTIGEYISNTINFEWDFDSQEAWLHIGGSCIRLTYVHEVQHALRLCGCDELADYFKIE